MSQRTFVIAAQPRTGSHALASALGVSRLEPLHDMHAGADEKARELRRVCERDGGAIVHDHQWYGVLGDSAAMYWQPDAVIWLWRENAFAQAASHYVACLTHTWEGETPRLDEKIVLNAQDLVTRYAGLVSQRPRAMKNLVGVRTQVFTTYEQVVGPDSRQEITRLAVAIGLDVEKTSCVSTKPSRSRDKCANWDEARRDFWRILRREGV